MAYITVDYINDKDVKRVVEVDSSFLSKADDYLLAIYERYSITAPTLFSGLSYNAKALLEWKVVELVCSASMGRNLTEVQDQVLDKYAIKYEYAIKRIYGDKELSIAGLEEIVSTQIAGTKKEITLEYNF